MKRIVTSLGVAALGAACVQSSNAQSVGGDGSKPWSVSVALRGFYDDNVRSVSNDADRVDSFGIEINPSLGFELALDQTLFSLAYTYSYKYYEKRPDTDGDHDDQTHTIVGRLLHHFNERTSLSVSDSFVIGQEPDVLRSGPITVSPQSLSGDNVRNYANITVNHQFSPKFGAEAGYANSIFDYEATSRSSVLDRMEHTVHVDARWTLQPTTVVLLGYQYGQVNYTADALLDIVEVPAGSGNFVPVFSDSRDSQSHYGYAGVEHSFRPDLTGSLRVGARFTDYINSILDESSVSPYVSASLRYNYAPDCNAELGVTHDLSATDNFSVGDDGSITSDMESTVVYGSVTHKILPDLFGTLMGTYQNSTFNGGTLDGSSEDYFLASVALEYRINRHVSATVSYHYDLLCSDLSNRSFDRNRVFLGATFSY